jgi:mannose-6-phosphate isomerase-like protein (cupin superfamily)
MPDAPATRQLAEADEVTAPDGSTVRPLCRITGRGSFAQFRLAPGEISTAVSHATVEEIWFVVGGSGQMWRRHGSQEEIVALRPGTCLTIPLGTVFQFRTDEVSTPLEVVAATMPPWPIDGEHEARLEQGAWAPTLPR